MPERTVEPLDADCPICDRQVLRVTMPGQAWGSEAGQQNVKFVCSSGAQHMPWGWHPNSE